MTLTADEAVIYNVGERLTPGRSHDHMDVRTHNVSYLFFQQVIAYDRARSPAPGGTTIVDLGCGVGHGCNTLAQIPGVRIRGADVLAASLEGAELFFQDLAGVGCRAAQKPAAPNMIPCACHTGDLARATDLLGPRLFAVDWEAQGPETLASLVEQADPTPVPPPRRRTFMERLPGSFSARAEVSRVGFGASGVPK